MSGAGKEMESQVSTYRFPFPLTEANLMEVATTVVSSIADEATPRLHYFLSSLFLLQMHSNPTQLIGRNVTLTVTDYQPNVTDPGVLWRKENAWVKIKVQGGTAPRANFIATNLGIASVNWKTSERSLLGLLTDVQGTEVLAQFRSGALFIENQRNDEGERVLRRGNSLERISLASAIFGDLMMMTPQAASRLLSDPAKLTQIGTQLFDIFDEDKSGAIDRKEFIKFFSKFLLQPLELTLAVFEQIAGQTPGIKKGDFINILGLFLQTWLLEDAEKQQKFLWTSVVNLLFTVRSEDRVKIFSDEKRLENLAEQFYESVNASGRSLTFEEFALLQCRFDSAIYNIPKSDQELRGLFQTFAVDGSMPLKQFVKFLTIALQEIYQFITDWIQQQTFNDEYRSMDLETLRAWSGNTEQLREYYSRVFQSLGALDKMTGKQLAVLNRCAELPIPVVPNYSVLELPIDWALDYSAAQTKKSIEDDIEHPGKTLFTDIAALNTERLIMLSLEEFRLKAIAHSVFTSFRPYREKHDLKTFQQYAVTMCELFQVEHIPEYVTQLFCQFSQEENLLTEAEFVLCLKQMIGQQMKWAKSRDLQEGMKKQQIAAILENPEATRALTKECFDKVDVDHDGWISRAELKNSLVSMAENDSMIKFEGDVDVLYDQLDTDHDGKLNLDEYGTFLVQSLKQYSSN